MNSVLIIFSIFSNAVGRDIPTDVRCVDARTGISLRSGAYLDAQEAVAVVQLAEAYERGCTEKLVSLSDARDEQESSTAATTGAASAVTGFAAGSGLLAFLKRKKK